MKYLELLRTTDFFKEHMALFMNILLCASQDTEWIFFVGLSILATPATHGTFS